MARHETSEKRAHRNTGGGIFALIVILLIAGTIGYLYYSIVKAPLSLDDPQKLAASAPMEADERFAFSSDGTVRVKLDKGDIWHLILAHTGADFLDIINNEISPYGLTVSGCAIHLDEEGLRLDVEAFYKEIRLVVKAPCNVEITGQHISLIPTGVPLPVSGLLSSVNLEYDLALPVIADVTGTYFLQDALILTGSVEDIDNLLPPEEKLLHTMVFSEAWQSQAATLRTPENREARIAHLQKDPGAVEELYRDLFTLAASDTAEAYLAARFGLTQRFFPNIDFEAVAAERSALEEQLAGQGSVLKLFLTCAVNDFNEKKFVLSNGQFLKNWVPFQPTQYGETCAALFEILDPETFFLVLVDAEDGHIRKTSTFEKMANKNQKFTQPVDFTKTYILGCVLRGVTGQPYLMYEAEIRENNTYYSTVRLIPLTEEEAAALQVPDTFGVYIG